MYIKLVAIALVCKEFYIRHRTSTNSIHYLVLIHILHAGAVSLKQKSCASVTKGSWLAELREKAVARGKEGRWRACLVQRRRRRKRTLMSS